MNVQQLVSAIGQLGTQDALQCRLSLEEWRQLAPYLAVRFLQPGDVLMREGDTERELFILAEGELQVVLNDAVLARLRPGTVVGEGAFFSGQPRSATVRADGGCVVWGLTWARFEAMCHKHPRLALDLTRALAAVLAVRMREAILVGHFA